MSEADPKVNPARLSYAVDPPGAPLVGEELGLGFLVREMWAVYKRWNDPPGMWVGFNRAEPFTSGDRAQAYPRFGLKAVRWELSVPRLVPYVAWPHEARKDAWAYYDARLVLAEQLEAAGVVGVWPRVLRVLDLGPFEAWTSLRLGVADPHRVGPCPELPAW